jgi:hypothetical protein
VTVSAVGEIEIDGAAKLLDITKVRGTELAAL